jgi:hypothetical protein
MVCFTTSGVALPPLAADGASNVYLSFFLVALKVFRDDLIVIDRIEVLLEVLRECPKRSKQSG